MMRATPATRPRRGGSAFNGIVLVVLAALASGCAHPLNIAPDIAAIERRGDTAPMNGSVGYYLPPGARDQAVTTPGGGGDSVTYHPYKDIEAGFYKMLSNVFKNVTLLKSRDDAETIARQSIRYVITPEIKTDSSSPSAFTWPPTTFSVNLVCNIADTSGRPVGKPSVTGLGRAEYDEFKSDYSLSGKRAAQDALLKMQDTLLKMPELGGP